MELKPGSSPLTIGIFIFLILGCITSAIVVLLQGADLFNAQSGDDGKKPLIVIGDANQVSDKNTVVITVPTPVQGTARLIIDKGRDLFGVKGCKSCHSVDSSRSFSRSLKNSVGQTRDCLGKKVTFDYRYFKLFLLDPNACQGKGKPKSVMPPYGSIVSEEEMTAMYEFVKSLK